MPGSTSRVRLTRAHRLLIAVVLIGGVVVAGIGFAGSYAAVRELAIRKGFEDFSYFFPIGIDAGICVLLALDLLLTWIRMPFPLLRQTAWLLTVATVTFNAAAASDPLGMGMHAVIPVLFVVTVEAARHAIGRIADITADKHMEGVRLTRWLLAPVPTFLLWRRMKLWELRSYDQVIKLEQERLVYQARLRSRFGRAWRRKAPVESLMPLRLARYGVPLAETASAGLVAAGIEPHLLPARLATPRLGMAAQAEDPAVAAEESPSQWSAAPQPAQDWGGYEPEPNYEPPTYVPEPQHQPGHDGQPQQIPVPEPHATQPAPVPAQAQASGRDSGPHQQPDSGRTGGTTADGEDPPASADRPEPDATPPTAPAHDEAAPAAGSDPPQTAEAKQTEKDHRAHTQALAELRPADAVRYAIKVLDSLETPVLVDWLKRHGKKVNRGQVYKIAENAAKKRAAQDQAVGDGGKQEADRAAA